MPFQAHVELLQGFLARRAAIVEKIQDVLNARRKPIEYLQDRRHLSGLLQDCFFASDPVPGPQAALKNQLEEAHWASGFRPCQVPGLVNDLIDPAEMTIRAFHCWQQTRWPGRSGRLRYAQTLFNVYLLRRLELLSMRVWDAGSGAGGDRLADIQRVLDELWQSAPSDLPALVRDARWLIPLALSPTTDELAGYFDVAACVAGSFSDEHCFEIRKAAVVMLGGHLRSQLRHYCVSEGVAFDEPSVVRRSRTTNALDFALLIQYLVPLLEAYEKMLNSHDNRSRLEVAGAICQGLSADPDLFVGQVELLGAYSMIEGLFVSIDRDGLAAYTPMGERQVRLFAEYTALIARLAAPLSDDCMHFRPVDGYYSPYGAIFGTPSTLTELLALKTLELDAETRFSLEDAFVDRDASADKRAWADGWRKLPHIDPAVQKQYEYPQQFAEAMFDRMQQAWRRRAEGRTNEAARSGHLFLVPETNAATDVATNADGVVIPALPVRYIGSSDRDIVAHDEAVFYDEKDLLHHRSEGHFLVSFPTANGWLALSKDLLTEVLGAGSDAKIVGLPAGAARALQLICPDGLVDQASMPPSIVKA